MTWENLFSLELSSYKQWAENSVIYRPLSPSLGYGNLARPDNIGSMEMEGFEALFRASPIKKKDLNVDMSLSYSWNNNTVKKMGDPVFDNFGSSPLGKVIQNILYGVKKSMAPRLILLILHS